MFPKKRVSRGDNSGGGKLRDLYSMLFKLYGIMPEEVSRQSPADLFMMLEDLESPDTTEERIINNPHLMMFYGQ